MSKIFSNLIKSLILASVVAPAGISPAVAGCCGGMQCDKGSLGTVDEVVGSESYQTQNSVTNTSMQMVVTEGATYTPVSAPTDTVIDIAGCGSVEEVM